MRLVGMVAALSTLVSLVFWAWLAFGPAPAVTPASAVAGGLRYWELLRRNPAAWPTEPDYSLAIAGTRIPFGDIITCSAMLAVSLGTWWGVNLVRVRDRRRRRGLCASCGYDLRATPGRCPECGTVVESVPASG